MPDLKPAKIMFHRLAAANRGERVEPYAGRFANSVNMDVMDATLQFLSVKKDPGPLENLLANMEETGHAALRRGPRVACEAGTIGAHYSMLMAALAVAAKAAKGELQARLVDRLMADVGLHLPFEVAGEYYVPAPRVPSVPWDGTKNVFLAVATGREPELPLRRGGRRRPLGDLLERFDPGVDSAVAVNAMWNLITRGIWNVDAARTAPWPKLFLPIYQRTAADGSWVAWVDESSEARAVGLEGWVDWVVYRPDGGVSWGRDWTLARPELT